MIEKINIPETRKLFQGFLQDEKVEKGCFRERETEKTEHFLFLFDSLLGIAINSEADVYFFLNI